MLQEAVAKAGPDHGHGREAPLRPRAASTDEWRCWASSGTVIRGARSPGQEHEQPRRVRDEFLRRGPGSRAEPVRALIRDKNDTTGRRPRSRSRSGQRFDTKRSAFQVVCDDLLVHGGDEAHDHCGKSPESPGDTRRLGARNMIQRMLVKTTSRNAINTDGEFRRHFPRHPSVGLAGGVEVARHAGRELIPDAANTGKQPPAGPARETRSRIGMVDDS